MSLQLFEKSLSSSLLLSSLTQMETWLHCHELSTCASALSVPSDHALNSRHATPITFFQRAAAARQQGGRRRVNALTSAGCASERRVSSAAERAPLRRQSLARHPRMPQPRAPRAIEAANGRPSEGRALRANLRDPCHFDNDPVTSIELAESFLMVGRTSPNSQGLAVVTFRAFT